MYPTLQITPYLASYSPGNSPHEGARRPHPLRGLRPEGLGLPAAPEPQGCSSAFPVPPLPPAVARPPRPPRETEVRVRKQPLNWAATAQRPVSVRSERQASCRWVRSRRRKADLGASRFGRACGAVFLMPTAAAARTGGRWRRVRVSCPRWAGWACENPAGVRGERTASRVAFRHFAEPVGGGRCPHRRRSGQPPFNDHLRCL